MSKAREYNLKQIMRRCGNWRIGAQVCAAGVNTSQWPRLAERPCVMGDTPAAARSKCSHFRSVTPEEAEAELAAFDADMARLATARRAIVDHAGEYKPGKPSVGTIACPICTTGQLDYIRDASNGHIRAACSTEKCVSWME